MALTLTSVSPGAGPPGATLTLTGSGFTCNSQVACPVLVATTFSSSTTLLATVPADLDGPPAGSMTISVYVQNADSSVSNYLPFTVLFPAITLQAWTTIDRVAKSVPGFVRGAQITDDDIAEWISEAAQEIAAAMLKRALPLDSALWPAADVAAFPTPQGLLEMANRAGAASLLAAAIASNFSAGSPWAPQVALQKQYERHLAAFRNGDYDKLFRSAAATIESGPLLAAGDLTTADGKPSTIFAKDKVF